MRIDSATKLTCLLGHPISHSLSPAIHNSSFEFLGINAVYLAFDVQDFPKALDGLRELAVGCNVTIPYKEMARRLVEGLDEMAELTGSVNTVKFGEELVGYNTDVSGVIHSLDLLGVGELDEALLLGAGGAARSVLVGLSGRVRKVYVTSRRLERAKVLMPLCERLGLEAIPVPWEVRESYASKADLLVNATPLGTLGNGLPLNPNSLRPGCYVFDLVYNPPDTELVRRARERGCKALGGLSMLIRQAAEAEKIWFGVIPDEGIMADAAFSSLGGADGSS